MARPLTPASGWCGGMPGISMAFIRSGPRRRLSKRERKWEREKSHRRRRHRWSRWPKVKMADFIYVLSEKAMEAWPVSFVPFKWAEESK